MEKSSGYAAKFEALQRISCSISSIYNMHRLLSFIMDESKKILNAEASSLLLFDKKEKVLFFEVADEDKENVLRKIKLKLGQGVAGACAMERKIINVRDVRKDSRFYSGADSKTKFKTRNILAVPVLNKGKLVGVLEVLNKKNGRYFSSADEKLMEVIASQAALCIENARLYRANMLNAKMAGVGETMLSLSHDIKNILNGLTGGISLIDSEMTVTSGEYAAEGWDMVKTNVNRISELILDMLNYSSRKKPLFSEISLIDFIKDTLAVYGETLKEKKVTFNCFQSGEIPLVFIDASGMQRVILNLFGNALEAVPDNTGIINVSVCPPVSGFYEIKISDNGKGIPSENLKKVFDIFFSTKGHKGTGLGLAVVKKIVSEHNGSVAVESEQGRGTVFSLKMPLNPANEKKKTL